MLLSSNFGISWSTFPKPGASIAEQVAAQLDICSTLTAEMDTLANMHLRATQDVEQEFGPDLIITIRRNGWARFRLSAWPILQLVGGQVSPSSANPPAWSTIPATAMITEHSMLPLTGSSVPSASGPGPTAALIAPGYVDWANGRDGYLVQVTSINGFPVCGIDQSASVGDSFLHVDDITGWWLGTGSGARGVICDPPFRESVTVIGATPDTAGAISGSGTLSLTTPLQFAHAPLVGSTSQADQRILLSAMPPALIQAGYYFATFYGLMRGATAAVMQSGRGGAAPSSAKAAADWYELGKATVSRFARVF
jgi:hypothetical protein